MPDLLKKLDAETLRSYADELADHVTAGISPQAAPGLAGDASNLQALEHVLESDYFREKISQVADGCVACIATCPEAIAVVSGEIPLLSELLFDQSCATVEAYVGQPHLNYLVNISGLCDSPSSSGSAGDAVCEVEDALVALNSLNSLLLKNSSLGTTKLDTLVLRLVCLSDSDLVHAAASILKLRMDRVAGSSLAEFLWPIVSGLVATSLEDHKTVGYKTWLWWLNECSSQALESPVFQELFQTEKYWFSLLEPLKTLSYDHKKLALYVISRSVQHINCNIDLANMTWSLDDREALLEQWKRFATLTEIIAIDSSFNQTVACEGDILTFLSSKSKLAAQWGISLIAMGLNATMDTVRKYMAKLVLTLPELAVFQHDIPFLESRLLPYLLEATHFTSTRVDRQIECVYGDTLEVFIRGLYETFDSPRVQQLTVCIFRLLTILREGFDPSKIYALAGVTAGLRATKLQLADSTLDDFAPMLLLTSETGVRRKLQKLYLARICLHFRPSLRVLKLLTQLVDLATVRSSLDFSIPSDPELRKSIDELSVYAVYLCGSGEPVDVAEAASQLGLLPVGVSLGLQNLGVEGVPDVSVDNVALLSSSQACLALAKSTLAGNLETVHSELLKLQFSKDMDLAASQLTLLAALNVRYGKGDFGALFGYLKSSHTVSRDLGPGESISELNRLVAAKFDCLNSCHVASSSSTHAISPDEVVNFATLCYSVASSTDARYAVVACILRSVLSSNPPRDDTIQDSLFAIWEEIMSEGLVSSAKPAHLAFIELLLSNPVLSRSVENESLAETVLDIVSSLVTQCFARRSLLPQVARKLYEFGAGIVALQGVHSLVIQIYTLQQIDDANFRLEDVIARRYNRESSEPSGSPRADVYRQIHGSREVSAKALIALLVSQITSPAFAELVWDEIFTSEAYRLFNPKKLSDGKEERVRVQCYQLLTMTEELISADVLEKRTKTLIDYIRYEPSPPVRMYMEWIIARVLIKGDGLGVLRENLANPEEIPRVLAAFQRIGLLIGEQIPEVPDRISFLTEYLNIVLPYCSSNRAAVRHFAVSMTCAVGPWIQSKAFWGCQEAVETMKPLAKTCMGIFSHATRQETYQQFRSGEKMLWNVHRYYNLVGICGGLILRLSDREFPFIGEGDFLELSQTPTPPHVDLVCPIESTELVLPSGTSDGSSRAGRISVGSNDSSVWTCETAVAEACGIQPSSVSAPVQTKSGAWNSTLQEDSSEESRAAKIIRGDLILVASLVDKPPNLGGICRLSDVLGAQLLTLNDISVAKHPQFKNVAVTAEQWMPMAEVKVAEIAAFMRAKKKEGYTLIGLEQTDQSRQLNSDFVFPKKSLILLGMEREGIPGNLLAELDYAVEIKQIGMIRSMNIQTAAAVIVHAYSMQHCA